MQFGNNTQNTQQLFFQFKQQSDTTILINQNQIAISKSKKIYKMMKSKSTRAFQPLNQDKKFLEKPAFQKNNKKNPQEQPLKKFAPKIQLLNTTESKTQETKQTHFACENPKQDTVFEYEDEIISYLKSEQKKYKVDQQYVKQCKNFTVGIRTHIVKYMIKITKKYQCTRKTLFLAVFCFDYFLSKKQGLQTECKNYFVLTAQAALHIAMKQEEIYPPALRDFTDISKKQEILTMEAEILKILNWKLNLPSIAYFEEYFKDKFRSSKEYLADKEKFCELELTIDMISDLCLFDVNLYEFEPYMIAENIRRLVYKSVVPFREQRVVLNLKWAIERNSAPAAWLKQFKYQKLNI